MDHSQQPFDLERSRVVRDRAVQRERRLGRMEKGMGASQGGVL